MDARRTGLLRAGLLAALPLWACGGTAAGVVPASSDTAASVLPPLDDDPAFAAGHDSGVGAVMLAASALQVISGLALIGANAGEDDAPPPGPDDSECRSACGLEDVQAFPDFGRAAGAGVGAVLVVAGVVQLIVGAKKAARGSALRESVNPRLYFAGREAGVGGALFWYGLLALPLALAAASDASCPGFLALTGSLAVFGAGVGLRGDGRHAAERLRAAPTALLPLVDVRF